MADKITLKLDKRTITGRKVKQLRTKGILPGNIYGGKGIKSLAVQLSTTDFKKAFKKAGETNIINAQVNKETKTRPVLISDIHVHPVTDEYLHVDLHQVDLTKKITVNIPVELSGIAPAVSKGGVLIQVLDEIEVQALPTDLPDKFELDITHLEEIGQTIALKDIKVNRKVKLTTEDLNSLVVKVEEPTKEEEKPVEEVPAEDEEGEAVEGEEGEVKEGEIKEGETKPGEKPDASDKDSKETAKPEEKPSSTDKGGKGAKKEEKK